MNKCRNGTNASGNFYRDAENFALIDGYDKYQEKFRDSRINSKTVWNDIAHYVNEHCRTTFTGRQCNKRWNYLRRQYAAKIQNSGRTGRSAKASKWPFWDRMNSVLGNDPSVVPAVIAGSRGVRRPRLEPQTSTSVPSPGNSVDDSAETSSVSMASVEAAEPGTSSTPEKLGDTSVKSGSRPKRARRSRQDTFLSEIRRMHDEKIDAFRQAEAEKCALLSRLLERLDKNGNN